MSHGPEWTFAEKPTIEVLEALGYTYLPKEQAELARDGLNQVLLRDELVSAIMRINDVPEDVARGVYHEMVALTDNEKWTGILRGNYSRHVPDAPTKKTIRLIDFKEISKNSFVVTNQVYVKAEKSRIADVVVYVNGIPLVVIEAKSPLAGKDKTSEAFEQIKQYERDIPRLFYSNAFSLVTDGVHTPLYGTTGTPSDFWGAWKDPWPRSIGDFKGNLERTLWCLLEPSRLLDILAHFIVFERRDEKIIKKMCRYQQYRAVNKIVDRVIDGKDKRGLIWHTQGSGKSLTMVFAALKLKSHLTIDDPALTSPNILVLTDRIQLDDQITKTFQACGLPNPENAGSKAKLKKIIHSGVTGLMALSTIFKFDGLSQEAANSADWIVLVDECHRTQEKDLGIFLRKTLKDARFFGFTGTPIKKNDKDTYANFGAPGEGYLDRYSIDDAVADGATVPIRYTSRKAEWQVDPEKLDIQFDQWFAGAPEEKIKEIKKRGISIADLAKNQSRVNLLALDIWVHYLSHVMPDGFKAQVVTVDREAVILYRRALGQVISEYYQKAGMTSEEAKAQAESMIGCVYSGSQEDGKPSEDAHVKGIRKDLVRFLLEGKDETEAIKHFTDEKHPLRFLIVCDKLLTGFDAPVESVMYLDKPLKDHNLLQAIARTNRVSGSKKQYGLIVDYIGVTRKLNEALESYREADVVNAMRDLAGLEADLKEAHKAVMEMLKGISLPKGPPSSQALYQLKTEFVQAIGTEDVWFTFRNKAKAFIRAYSALAPEPEVLPYTNDMKWMAGLIAIGTLEFDKKDSPDLGDYSAKIREMLEEHLHVTGIRTLVKLRQITDPDFNNDFDTENKSEDEIKTAAVRKAAELKKTLTDKKAENPIRWGPFSERVLEVLRRMEEGQTESADNLKDLQKITEDIQAEELAHKDSGLNQRAYGLLKILEAFGKDGEKPDPKLKKAAATIDGLYASDDMTPSGWHLKEQMRKKLRQQVRMIGHDLGLEKFKDIPARVDEYALKHYVKL